MEIGFCGIKWGASVAAASAPVSYSFPNPSKLLHRLSPKAMLFSLTRLGSSPCTSPPPASCRRTGYRPILPPLCSRRCPLSASCSSWNGSLGSHESYTGVRGGVQPDQLCHLQGRRQVFHTWSYLCQRRRSPPCIPFLLSLQCWGRRKWQGHATDCTSLHMSAANLLHQPHHGEPLGCPRRTGLVVL